jgi:phage terminase large subunit
MESRFPYLIITTYLNNRNNLSESYLKRLDLIKQNNPGKYKHLVLGGWLEKAEGVIFENWQEGTFDDSLPFVYGMDFGYVTDPTTLVKIAKDWRYFVLKRGVV